VQQLNKTKLEKKMNKLIVCCLANGCAMMLAAAAIVPAHAASAISPPTAGKGQVVFFRPSAMGMAIRCTVRNQGKLVGQVGNGKYFIQSFDPGKYQFTTKTEATDTLNMEVEPGETYYVKCKVGGGIMAGRPNLSPSDKAAFDAKSAKLKLKTSEELAEDVAEDAKKGS
jgi:hypothetical protein